jgi:hypothetical protein
MALVTVGSSQLAVAQPEVFHGTEPEDLARTSPNFNGSRIPSAARRFLETYYLRASLDYLEAVRSVEQYLNGVIARSPNDLNAYRAALAEVMSDLPRSVPALQQVVPRHQPLLQQVQRALEELQVQEAECVRLSVVEYAHLTPQLLNLLRQQRYELLLKKQDDYRAAVKGYGEAEKSEQLAAQQWTRGVQVAENAKAALQTFFNLMSKQLRAVAANPGTSPVEGVLVRAPGMDQQAIRTITWRTAVCSVQAHLEEFTL